MRQPEARRAVPALCALALAGAGCGDERQDAGAPSGAFSLDVAAASFPARQRLADPVTLELRVRNTGDRAVPDLAVTVATEPGAEGEAPAAFATSTGAPGLASGHRPVWVLDEGPPGGGSAYVDTWSLGPLAAGASRTLRWRLTPVRAGRHTVSWRLAPALEGGARATGRRVAGEFRVSISDAPVRSRVDGSGGVVRSVGGN